MSANCKSLMELQIGSRHNNDSMAYVIKFCELFNRLSAEDVADLFNQLGIPNDRDFNTLINTILDDTSHIVDAISIDELKEQIEFIQIKGGLTVEQKDAILLRIGV